MDSNGNGSIVRYPSIIISLKEIAVENSCANCKFYEAIQKRGQRYPRGVCHKHFAYRISDRFTYYLTVTSPYEYKCDLYEESQQPVYAFVDGETFLVPPIIVNDLLSKGWKFVKLTSESDKTIIEKKDNGGSDES